VLDAHAASIIPTAAKREIPIIDFMLFIFLLSSIFSKTSFKRNPHLKHCHNRARISDLTTSYDEMELSIVPNSP
jgi:hypothetical protein